MQKFRTIGEEQCPTCAESGGDRGCNNRILYENGGYWCYKCNEGSIYGNEEKETVKSTRESIIVGQILAISSRGISQETCKFFGYTIGQDQEGKWVQCANYYSGDKVIAQQLRYEKDPETGKKVMPWRGADDKIGLYGEWLWSPNEKLFITVVEGALDAMSIAQVQGYQYPVVSIPKGSGSAEAYIKRSLKYLLGFKYVVLAFDSDDAGNKAVRDCLPLFEPGRVRVATWPLNDANEMLLGNKAKEIKEIIFRAQEITPEYCLEVDDELIQRVIDNRPQFGSPYKWPSMTEITYGYQLGEIHTVVGPTGIGKTEFIKDILFDRLDKGTKAGLFSFEQNADDSLRRIIGAKLGIKLHIPGEEYDREQIIKEGKALSDKIRFYDKAGAVDLKDIFYTIRYWVKARGCTFFILDNLQALEIGTDMEKAQYFMNTLKAMSKELMFTIFLVSHVSKDKYGQTVYTTTSPANPSTYYNQTAEQTDTKLKKPGMDWETGRMPTVNNVEGSGVITKLSNYVWGLARNTEATNDIEKRTLRVKALKTRLDSRKTGKVFKLIYNDRGTLEETDNIQTSSNPSEGAF